MKTTAHHIVRTRRCLATALVAAALCGCSHQLVVSEPIANKADAGTAERGGLIYSLPMTIITVTGARDDKNEDKVIYTVTPTIVPDPSARYRIKYEASGYSDDDLKLEVDKNGLLTSTKGNATDKTGDIIVAVGKTIAAGGVSFAPAPPGEQPRVAGKKQKEVYPFTKIFTVDEFLESNRIDLPDGATIDIDKAWRPPQAELTGTAPSCSYSVCFRRVFPIRATINRTDADTAVSNQFAFVAVNPHLTEGIDLKTASLVARQNTVTFTDGLITSVAINQQSTMLAIVSLPLTVLKAILAVPGELLTIKVTNAKAEADLVRAQADLLVQMKAVLDAQQALETARANSRQAGKPNPVTGTGSSP